MALNVSLTPELEDLVRQRVESGDYASASEVVRAALRLLRDQEELRSIQLEELRRKVAEGLDAADRGDLVDGPAAMQDLKASLSRRTPGKKGG